MRSPDNLSFKRAVILALIAHGILLAVLLLRVSFSSKDSNTLVINPNVTPIQATLVDERKLKAEVNRLEAIEQKKVEETLAHEAELKRQEDLKKQKIAEAKRLEEQKKQAEVEKQNKLAQEKVAKEKAAKDKVLAEAAEKKAKAQAQVQAQAASEAAKVKAKAEADRLAREKALANTQSAAQQAEALREIERYKAMVRQQIMRYWVVQQGLGKQDATKLFVRVAPTGTVLDVKVIESSGNDALDRSAVAAVYKASPLPVPQDPDLFRSFRELRLTLRPDSILSEG